MLDFGWLSLSAANELKIIHYARFDRCFTQLQSGRPSFLQKGVAQNSPKWKDDEEFAYFRDCSIKYFLALSVTRIVKLASLDFWRY